MQEERWPFVNLKDSSSSVLGISSTLSVFSTYSYSVINLLYTGTLEFCSKKTLGTVVTDCLWCIHPGKLGKGVSPPSSKNLPSLCSGKIQKYMPTPQPPNPRPRLPGPGTAPKCLLARLPCARPPPPRVRSFSVGKHCFGQILSKKRFKNRKIHRKNFKFCGGERFGLMDEFFLPFAISKISRSLTNEVSESR